MAKICNKCKLLKEPDCFYKRSDYEGLRSSCVKCTSKVGIYGPKKAGPKFKYSDEERRAKRLESLRKCNSKRKHKQAYYQATRENRKRGATPKWLNKNQLEAIKATYETAKILTHEFGIRMEVDHIIPLNGKDVCGLHVPWNLQVMVGDANRRKGNRLET